MQAIELFLTEGAAAEQAGDSSRLEALLSGDFTAIGPLGYIFSREGWLARHRQGGPST